MKKALIIGIDHYDNVPALNGCVRDAVAMATVLKVNGDGSPNFDVRLITSDNCKVSTSVIEGALNDLFSGESEIALFYFAGHGTLKDDVNQGYLVAEDCNPPFDGVSLQDLMTKANNSSPQIKSTVILLDSCKSRIVGESLHTGIDAVHSQLGQGVTILSACQRDVDAKEVGGQGKFTDVLLEGLQGAASNVIGKITPASIYALVDQTFGAWDQRPIYKANVQNFVSLREVDPKVPLEFLRNLPKYFPTQGHEFKLDPTFEPNRGEETEKLKDIPVIEANVEIYRQLQKCNQHGLVSPTSFPFMWHSAVFSSTVKLTALGAFHWRMAKENRI